jgi:hypothetical protein
VYQVRDIGNWLQYDLGAVESATASRSTGSQLLCASLLAFLCTLGLIHGAPRLIEDVLHLLSQIAHRSSSAFCIGLEPMHFYSYDRSGRAAGRLSWQRFRLPAANLDALGL